MARQTSSVKRQGGYAIFVYASASIGAWPAALKEHCGTFLRRGLALALFAAVVLAPWVGLVMAALRSPTSWSEWLFLALPVRRHLGLLTTSVSLAAGVALSGIAIGVAAATVLWRRCGPARFLRWLPLVLLPIPPYAHALAWNAVGVAVGGLCRRLGVAAPVVPGWLASWWVQLMAYLPLAVGLALVGQEGVERRVVEAGVLLRPDGAVWRRIVLPLAAPALAAGAGLLFVLSLGDYSVPSLFGVSVYALEIFADFSASGEPARAMALGLPLLLIATITAIALQGGLRHAAQAPDADRSMRALHAPAWFRPVQGIALFFCLLQMGVLLGALGLTVGGPAQLGASVGAAGREIRYTAWLASLCAILVLPLALLAAQGLSWTGWYAHLWWLLATMPLAVPAPLVGIGLIALYNRPTWPDLYALGALPVLANLARFAPVAALVALAQAQRLDRHLLDAGRLLQRRPWQTLLQVRLPLMAPGLMAGAALVFAFTAGELGATLIVALPGAATLTMRIYNYLHYGASADVAGLCLVLAGCALLAGSAATALLRRRY